MGKKTTPMLDVPPAQPTVTKELLSGFIDFHNHKGNVTFTTTSTDSNGNQFGFKKEIFPLSESQMDQIKELIDSFVNPA